jgi:hypothetical protein
MFTHRFCVFRAKRSESSLDFDRRAMFAPIFLEFLSREFINSLVLLLQVQKLEIKLAIGGNAAHHDGSMPGIVYQSFLERRKLGRLNAGRE